ncbi:MAG: hypothetical protein COB54_08540 [Alphaproteobacteria bacterium]|nr:MAG: hypothetical protein COB54_08540 [Alphaproteobacteria bacterium]
MLLRFMIPLLLAAQVSVAKAQAEDVCEIIYSPIPHISAGQATGSERLEDVFKLGFAAQQALFLSLIKVTDSFFAAAPYITETISQVESHELVIGGYEGITTPSISMKVRLNPAVGNKMAAMETIAAAMGYFYIQDSVLIICPDDGQVNVTDSYSFSLEDTGEKPFFTDDNAPLFFGLMIGAFNGPDGLGYTYYKDSSTFSTLVAIASVSEDAAVFKGITRMLETLSHGDVRIGISQHKVDIAFPHNDWAAQPQGGAFKEVVADSFSENNLAVHRKKFLDVLDQHIKGNFQ